MKLMLLLQARGKMTVAELVKELEVSERTVYRDLVALDAAGVPIVTERGPGGGCYLVEGYTTKLTGLTSEEAASLFAADMPASLKALGMDETLGRAVAKLAAALPDRLRSAEAKGRSKILIDSGAYGGGDILRELRDALLGSKRLEIQRRFPYGPVTEARLRQEVEPLGLIATGREWLLVARCEAQTRILDVTDIVEAHATGEGFSPPGGFELSDYWEAERDRRLAMSAAYKARLLIRPEAAVYLRQRFGDRVERLASRPGNADEAGRVEIELGFASLEEALLILPGLGSAVRILEPELLRLALEDRALACAAANGSAGEDQLVSRSSLSTRPESTP